MEESGEGKSRTSSKRGGRRKIPYDQAKALWERNEEGLCEGV